MTKYEKTGVFVDYDDGKNEERAVVDTKWTQKGRLGLYKLLKDKGILPMIEQTSLVGIG